MVSDPPPYFFLLVQYTQSNIFCLYLLDQFCGLNWVGFYCTNPAILLVPTTERDQKKSHTSFKRAQSPSNWQETQLLFFFLNIIKYGNLLNLWKNNLQNLIKLFSHELPSWFVCMSAGFSEIRNCIFFKKRSSIYNRQVFGFVLSRKLNKNYLQQI